MLADLTVDLMVDQMVVM
jgi:hypothetical protein